MLKHIDRTTGVFEGVERERGAYYTYPDWDFFCFVEWG
jgi:hypothetical protein